MQGATRRGSAYQADPAEGVGGVKFGDAPEEALKGFVVQVEVGAQRMRRLFLRLSGPAPTIRQGPPSRSDPPPAPYHGRQLELTESRRAMGKGGDCKLQRQEAVRGLLILKGQRGEGGRGTSSTSTLASLRSCTSSRSSLVEYLSSGR